MSWKAPRLRWRFGKIGVRIGSLSSSQCSKGEIGSADSHFSNGASIFETCVMEHGNIEAADRVRNPDESRLDLCGIEHGEIGPADTARCCEQIESETLWQFQPYDPNLRMALRQGPSCLSDRSGRILELGSAFKVSEIVHNQYGGSWLRLANGNGWAYTNTLGGVMCVPYELPLADGELGHSLSQFKMHEIEYSETGCAVKGYNDCQVVGLTEAAVPKKKKKKMEENKLEVKAKCSGSQKVKGCKGKIMRQVPRKVKVDKPQIVRQTSKKEVERQWKQFNLQAQATIERRNILCLEAGYKEQCRRPRRLRRPHKRKTPYRPWVLAVALARDKLHLSGNAMPHEGSDLYKIAFNIQAMLKSWDEYRTTSHGKFVAPKANLERDNVSFDSRGLDEQSKAYRLTKSQSISDEAGEPKVVATVGCIIETGAAAGTPTMVQKKCASAEAPKNTPRLWTGTWHNYMPEDIDRFRDWCAANIAYSFCRKEVEEVGTPYLQSFHQMERRSGFNAFNHLFPAVEVNPVSVKNGAHKACKKDGDVAFEIGTYTERHPGGHAFKRRFPAVAGNPVSVKKRRAQAEHSSSTDQTSKQQR